MVWTETIMRGLTSCFRYVWRCRDLRGPSQVAWRWWCRWLCRCKCPVSHDTSCRQHAGRRDRSCPSRTMMTMKRYAVYVGSVLCSPRWDRLACPNRCRDRCIRSKLREDDAVHRWRTTWWPLFKWSWIQPRWITPVVAMHSKSFDRALQPTVHYWNTTFALSFVQLQLKPRKCERGGALGLSLSISLFFHTYTSICSLLGGWLFIYLFFSFSMHSSLFCSLIITWPERWRQVRALRALSLVIFNSRPHKEVSNFLCISFSFFFFSLLLRKRRRGRKEEK